MIPGINPSQMKAAMKQMGISQEEISADRVIIEKADGNIIIDNPTIVKIKMQGQESFQISGDVSEEEAGINEEDVKLVMEKTGKSEDEARKALEKSDGDLTEAIMELS